jgi:hypothetical protein
MKSKIKILVRPGLIRNKQVWLLYFKFDEKLISRIKLQFRAQWCRELKCWWMDYRETYIEQLRTWDDISILKSKIIYMNSRVILNKKSCFSSIQSSNKKYLDFRD